MEWKIRIISAIAPTSYATSDTRLLRVTRIHLNTRELEVRILKSLWTLRDKLIASSNARLIRHSGGLPDLTSPATAQAYVDDELLLLEGFVEFAARTCPLCERFRGPLRWIRPLFLEI